MSSKVLITGAAGFIGSHMVEAAKRAGLYVRATDIKSSLETDHPIKKHAARVTKELADELVPADLRDHSALKELVKGVDAVIHVASVFSYTAPWELLYSVNVEATKALLHEGSKAHVKRFVVIGAGGVYGLPRAGHEFTEDDPPDPPNNYLKSKWFEEFHVMNLAKRLGYTYTILRPTTVYGPRQAYGALQVLEMGYKSAVVGIPSNLKGRVPFIHVKDVAGAAVYLLDKKEAENEIFNVNDDSRYSMIEVMHLIAAAFNKPFMLLPPIPVKQVKDILMFIAHIDQEIISSKFGKKVTDLEKDTVAMFGEDFIYSNEKLKSTGYKFKYPDPKQGILETIQWYKEIGYFK